MRVEARYCDHCGIKIALDDLSSGDAIQLEDSVFHCKECKEKLGSKAKADEPAAKKKAENKALTSSRRLLTRRIQSGRLSRSKAKVPAALTASSDGADKAGAGEGDKKKAAADRAKTRDKLEKKKASASGTGKADSPEGKKAKGEEGRSEEGPAKKDKKKKKKKKAKDGSAVGAATAEKGVAEKGLAEKGVAEKAPDETSAKKRTDAGDKAGKGDKASKVDAAAPEAKAEAPSEAVASAPAEKAEKSEPAEKASEGDEKVGKAAVADAPAESKATRSEKVARAEKADASPDILKADSPPSSLTESPPEDTGSSVEDIVSSVGDDLAEAEAEEVKAKKGDKAEKAESATGAVAKTKKHEKPAKDEAKKAKADKKDAGKDDEGEGEAAEAKGKSIGTPSAKTKLAAGDKKKDKDDAGDETSASKKKDKKKSGGGTALAEDESAERKKTDTKSRTKKALGSATVAAEKPAKKGLPVLPLVGVLVLVLALVGVAAGLSGGGPKIEPFDRTKLFDDLKRYADDHPNDREEVVARWEGLRDAVDGELIEKINGEISQLEQRFQTQARSAVDELDGKVTAALKSKDFDAALGAIAAFPPRFRGSPDWQRRGATLQADVLKRRAAFEDGSALLKAAKESWEKDKDADVLSGLFAAFPTEYRETEEGRAIAMELKGLCDTAMDEQITSAGQKADQKALEREEAKYKKFAAERQKLEDAANAPEEYELSKGGGSPGGGFEWQIRDAYDQMHEPIKGAYVFGDRKLTITNERGSNPILIGKNKRDWNNFTIEFKIKVKKGTQVWFLGRIFGSERTGFEGHYDKLTLCNSAADSDKKPHFFTGIAEDQWVRLKYRCLGKGEYDVVVDGKDVYKCRVQTGGGGQTGGFAFMVAKGQVEIEDLKAKVISRKWDATASSEEE